MIGGVDPTIEDERPSLTVEQIFERNALKGFEMNGSVAAGFPPKFSTALNPRGYEINSKGGLFSLLQEGCGPPLVSPMNDFNRSAPTINNPQNALNNPFPFPGTNKWGNNS